MINALRPIDNRRLYQQIADQIRTLIKQGNYPEGARLPPERELATQLKVSRPSVREALIALEVEGCVEVRMGAGIYVCGSAAVAHRPGEFLGESPIALMQARAALEGAIVLLACGRATSEGMAALAGALSQMRAAVSDGRSPLEHDRAFHLAIASMTGNAVLARLVQELFDERHSPIFSRLSARSDSSQTWSDAMSEHEAIYRALETRDALAAQSAMGSHLQSSLERWVSSRRDWP